MLLDLLLQYLRDVEAAIQKLAGAYVERYEEEIVAANRANLRIRVRFPNGHLLELNESIIGEAGRLTHIGYRYHFQDGQKILFFDMITHRIFQLLRIFHITNTFLIK